MPSAPAASGTYTPSTYGSMLADPRGSNTLQSSVVSPLHDAQPAQPPARARTGMAAVIGALLALLFVAGVIIIVLVARPPQLTGAQAAQSAPPPAATTSATAVAPASIEAPASAPVVATPPASAAASASTSAAKTTPTVAAPVVKTVVARPKVNCDPPYTIDKKGHRHFIPECVQ